MLNAPSSQGTFGDTEYKMILVACGGNHTLALTSDNSVYAWGSNAHG